MQHNTSKITGKENQNERQAIDLNEHRAIQAREKIANLINNRDWQKFVSQKTLKGYQEYLNAQKGPTSHETASKSDEAPHIDDLEGLLGLYEFMSKEWEAAKQRLKRIEILLQAAITEKIASSSDMNFLISHLILTGEYDLSEENAQKFENIVIKKIARMRWREVKFRKFAQHKFADNIAIKKIEAKEKISLKDKGSFLEATVPERKKFLKLIKEALIKEEIQAAYNEKNLKKMKSLYLRKLKGKLSKKEGKGCIGKHTYEIFEKELENLDLDGLKIWHDGFEEEMAPREAFWKEVRSTFQGEGLAKMEKLIHRMGLGKLKEQYPIIKKNDKERLSKNYHKKLKVYKAQGLFGAHTEDEFMIWIDEEDLAVCYHAVNNMESWEAMGKYKALWQEVKTLSSDQQVFMKTQLKNSKWGYTEFKKQLDEFKNETDNEDEKVNESEAALSRIRDSAIKDGVEDMQANLENRSFEEQDKIINIMEIQARLKHEPTKLETIEEGIKNESESMSRAERMEIELGKTKEMKNEKAEITELSDFKKIKTAKGDNIKHVMVNQQSGIKNLLANFSGSKKEAEQTKISISKEGQDDKDIGKEAHHVVLYLKAKRKEEIKAKEEKIARTS